jgi:hypothetical protein
MFWKKGADDMGTKAINSIEYDACLKRISELSAEIKALSVKFEILQTDCSNLRGRFNQKLKSFGETEIPKPEQPKEINTNEAVYI